MAKQIEIQTNLLLRKFDFNQINERARKAIDGLKQSLIDAKIYTHSYELSEMREEQLANTKKANQHLEQARQNILKASEFDIFSAIDVAHLTAQIDQLMAELK